MQVKIGRANWLLGLVQMLQGGGYSTATVCVREREKLRILSAVRKAVSHLRRACLFAFGPIINPFLNFQDVFVFWETLTWVVNCCCCGPEKSVETPYCMCHTIKHDLSVFCIPVQPFLWIMFEKTHFTLPANPSSSLHRLHTPLLAACGIHLSRCLTSRVFFPFLYLHPPLLFILLPL